MEVTKLTHCVAIAFFKHAPNVALLLIDLFNTFWQKHVEGFVPRFLCVSGTAVGCLAISLLMLQASFFLRLFALCYLVNRSFLL